MFKITYGNDQVIYCTDVKREVLKMLSKRYYLDSSIMTINDIIDFALESKTIKTIEPALVMEPVLVMEPAPLMYDMDPYFTSQRVYNK